LGSAFAIGYEGEEGELEGRGGEGVVDGDRVVGFCEEGKGRGGEGAVVFCEEGKRRASGVWERRECGCG